MSHFIREPTNTPYSSDIKVDALLTPDKYIMTNQYTFSPYTNVEPWFQPNRDYNYYMINSNQIVDNMRYRKYMIRNSNKIEEYNTALYKKQWRV